MSCVMDWNAQSHQVGPTVCIPSHGRPNLLENALRALSVSMRASRLQHPVLVVVNGPVNYARQAESEFLDKFEDLLVVHDPVAGLARARNTALRLATTEWVAYLDDDAIPDESWALEAREAVRERTSVIAIGGPYFRMLGSDELMPRWMPFDFGTSYQGSRERVVDTVPGGNMIVHRESALRLGGFREDFGMQGDARLWGEESELQRRARGCGLNTVYVPTLRISHLLHGERATFLGALLQEWRKGLQAHSVKRWRRPGQLLGGMLYSFARALGYVVAAPVQTLIAPVRRRGMVSEASRCLLAAVARFAQGTGSLQALIRLPWRTVDQ